MEELTINGLYLLSVDDMCDGEIAERPIQILDKLENGYTAMFLLSDHQYIIGEITSDIINTKKLIMVLSHHYIEPIIELYNKSTNQIIKDNLKKAILLYDKKPKKLMEEFPEEKSKTSIASYVEQQLLDTVNNILNDYNEEEIDSFDQYNKRDFNNAWSHLEAEEENEIIKKFSALNDIVILSKIRIHRNAHMLMSHYLKTKSN